VVVQRFGIAIRYAHHYKLRTKQRTRKRHPQFETQVRPTVTIAKCEHKATDKQNSTSPHLTSSHLISPHLAADPDTSVSRSGLPPVILASEWNRKKSPRALPAWPTQHTRTHARTHTHTHTHTHKHTNTQTHNHTIHTTTQFTQLQVTTHPTLQQGKDGYGVLRGCSPHCSKQVQ
jgi:hypothetical protein